MHFIHHLYLVCYIHGGCIHKETRAAFSTDRYRRDAELYFCQRDCRLFPLFIEKGNINKKKKELLVEYFHLIWKIFKSIRNIHYRNIIYGSQSEFLLCSYHWGRMTFSLSIGDYNTRPCIHLCTKLSVKENEFFYS